MLTDIFVFFCSDEEFIEVVSSPEVIEVLSSPGVIVGAVLTRGCGGVSTNS